MYGYPTDKPEDRPVPRDQGPYPIDAFPEIIREAVVAVDVELGGGIELGASAALGVVSLVCQGVIDVKRPKLAPSSCSLFLITIAETGAGKSEIQKRFLTEVVAFERKEAARHRSLPEECREMSRSQADELLQERVRAAADLSARHRAMEGEKQRMAAAVKGAAVEVRRKATYTRTESGGQPSDTFARAEPRTKTSRFNQQHAAHVVEFLNHQLNKLEQERAHITAGIRDATGPARWLVSTEGSFAGFREELQNRCRSAGVISAEAGTILNGSLISANMPSWNNLWGCESYRETYKNHEYFIDRPRVTISLMLQPGQFAKFLGKRGEDALDNGFLSRTFLLKAPRYSARQSDDGVNDEVEIKALAIFNRRVKEILEKQFSEIAGPRVLSFSPEARRCWSSYRDKLNRILERGDLDQKVEGFATKLPEQAARIAALFHHFAELHKLRDANNPELQNEIQIDTVRDAIRICEWYLLEFRKLVVEDEPPAILSGFAGYAYSRSGAQKIFDKLKRHYPKYREEQGSDCVKLEYKKIQNSNRTIKNRGDIINALHILADAGEIHLGQGPKGGYYICYDPHKRYYACERCRLEVADRQRILRVSYSRRFEEFVDCDQRNSNPPTAQAYSSPGVGTPPNALTQPNVTQDEENPLLDGAADHDFGGRPRRSTLDRMQQYLSPEAKTSFSDQFRPDDENDDKGRG